MRASLVVLLFSLVELSSCICGGVGWSRLPSAPDTEGTAFGVGGGVPRVARMFGTGVGGTPSWQLGKPRPLSWHTVACKISVPYCSIQWRHVTSVSEKCSVAMVLFTPLWKPVSRLISCASLLQATPRYLSPLRSLRLMGSKGVSGASFLPSLMEGRKLETPSSNGSDPLTFPCMDSTTSLCLLCGSEWAYVSSRVRVMR